LTSVGQLKAQTEPTAASPTTSASESAIQIRMACLLIGRERARRDDFARGTIAPSARFPRRQAQDDLPGIIPAAVAAYLPVLVFLVMIVAFGGVSLAVAAVVRPARPSDAKLQSYECGPEPIGSAWIQFPIGFYLVALVFIVFDALVVFLFPWALVLRTLGWA